MQLPVACGCLKQLLSSFISEGGYCPPLRTSLRTHFLRHALEALFVGVRGVVATRARKLLQAALRGVKLLTAA
eukprot:15461647-Alexandrium_andersonii.AAC.1